MNLSSLTELAILIALVVTVAALVVVTITSGAASLPATGLRDLAIALAGGLLGAKVPRP